MKKRFLIGLIITMLFVLALALAGCKGLFGGLGGLGGGTWNGEKVELTKERFYSNPSEGARAYFYTGEPITVERNVAINRPDNSGRVSNDGFDFAYTNNVNAGTAKVKITAKEENEYYYGSVEFDFTISQGAVIVLEAEDLIRELKGDNVYLITVGGNIDLGTEALSIKEGVTLKINPSSTMERSFSWSGKLVNDGTLELEGTTSFYGAVHLYNDGEFVNNGTVYAGAQVTIFNGGTFQNNGTVKMTAPRYNIYTNGSEIANVLDADGKPATQHVRKQIARENIVLRSPSTVYAEYHDYNKIRFEIIENGTSRFVKHSYEYRNYERAGTACIDIAIDRADTYFYGSITVEYEIEKAHISVSNVSEFNECAATGNYGAYHANAFTVEAGETLVIEEGAVFYANKLYVSGTLVNGGRLVINNPTPSVQNGFCYINYDKKGAGYFENNGIVEVFSFSLFENGSALNRGVITASTASLRAPFTNEAGAEFQVNGDAGLYARLINKGTVEVTPESYLTLASLEGGTNGIDNSGSMRIDGVTVCRSLDSFSNSGSFENTDTVWSYLALPADFQNVVVKRQIVAADIAFEGGMPTYDGTAKPVTFAQSTALRQGQYRVEYTYEGEQPTTTEPVKAGRMTLTIRITDERTKYFAAASATDGRGILTEVPYEILHAERGVSTAQELYDYGSNDNYARLYLENDIVFSTARTGYGSSTVNSFTVSKGMVLDTNGHTLTLAYAIGTGSNPYISNYGTILNSKAVQYPVNYEPTEAECGLIFKQASLHNYGTLENNNLVYFDRRSTLAEQEGGKIVNHGLMYLVGFLTERTELVNDGTIYERELLSKIYQDKSRVRLEYWEADYNAKEHSPQVYLFDRSGEPVDTQNTTRFSVTAANDVAQRRCSVTLEAKDIFDKEFCGACILYVNILKSVAKVADINALIAATQDSNYIGYEMVQSFALNKNVTLPKDTFLDLGMYDFNRYYDDYKVDLTAGAELRVSVDTMTKFLKFVYLADKITFTGDITEEKAVEINFKTSTMGKFSNLTPFKKLYGGITIDLNGHYVGGQWSILNEYDPRNNTNRYFEMNIVDTGEGKTGRLGTATTKHGLSVGGETAMYLNLENITVGGLELYFTVYFTAKNCTFTTSSTTDIARAAYYCAATSNNNVQAVFENCTLSGAVGAYLARARHIFKNCTITANGAYSASGDWGSAIVINGNHARTGIDGGNVTSTYGYCMEFIGVYEVNTGNHEITRRTNIGSGEGSDETGRWSCGQATKLSDTIYTVVDALSGFGMIV